MTPHLQEMPWIRSILPTSSIVLRDSYRVSEKLWAIIAGSTLAFAVGFADDVSRGRFPVWAKLGGQLLGAIVLIAAGGTTSFLPFPWMNLGVTLPWMVRLTNPFNLLDHIARLSPGVAFLPPPPPL